MISYYYAVETCGEGYSCLRLFYNKQAFDLYMELVVNDEEIVTIDTGTIRVEGHIVRDDVISIEEVRGLFL